MPTFVVKIFRAGEHVDTQTVTLREETLAVDVQAGIEHNSIKVMALIQCDVPMRGARVTYQIEQIEEAR
jgi:hypothetical protein